MVCHALCLQDSKSTFHGSKQFGMDSGRLNATLQGRLFEGLGVEIVYLHLRKAHEFLGMQVLPTFMCNDVVKNPQVERYIKDYAAHLRRVLG